MEGGPGFAVDLTQSTSCLLPLILHWLFTEEWSITDQRVSARHRVVGGAASCPRGPTLQIPIYWTGLLRIQATDQHLAPGINTWILGVNWMWAPRRAALMASIPNTGTMTGDRNTRYDRNQGTCCLMWREWLDTVERGQVAGWPGGTTEAGILGLNRPDPSFIPTVWIHDGAQYTPH